MLKWLFVYVIFFTLLGFKVFQGGIFDWGKLCRGTKELGSLLLLDGMTRVPVTEHITLRY